MTSLRVDRVGTGATATATHRLAAIYCRVPHRRNQDAAGVAEQERLCREAAARHESVVVVTDVFSDQHHVSWLPAAANRPGWRALLAAVRGRRIGHVFLHLPTLAALAPCDLVELLRVAERAGVTVHGPIDDRDLADETASRPLREMAERECRRRQALRRSAREAHEAAAAAGRTHGGGLRRYGYSTGGDLVTAEVAIVREIFGRFLAGDSLRRIATDLNARQVPTAYDGFWSPARVARIIDAPRYAGLRVFRADIARSPGGRSRTGDWPPCVDLDDWQKAQALRTRRRAAQQQHRQAPRTYLLTGLVICEACDRHMVGSTVGDYPMYACSGKDLPGPQRCSRHVAANRLEDVAQQYVIERLSTQDSQGREQPPPPASRFVAAALARLAESDLTAGWQGLSVPRKRAVLDWMFAAIRIGPKKTPRSVFDYDRIEFLERHRT